MDAHMDLEIRKDRNIVIEEATFKWFFTGMDTHVNIEITEK